MCDIERMIDNYDNSELEKKITKLIKKDLLNTLPCNNDTMEEVLGYENIYTLDKDLNNKIGQLCSSFLRTYELSEENESWILKFAELLKKDL